MSRSSRPKSLLRIAVAFSAGLALWLAFAAPYRATLTGPAQWLLRLTEDPPVTMLRADSDPSRIVVDRTDFPKGSPRPVIRVREMTYNVVLLVALFGFGAAFSDRNIAGLAISLILLWVSHVLALVVQIRKMYALQLGSWSSVHYTSFWQNFWGFLDHFYNIVGAFAIAFGLWWLFGRGKDAGVRRPRTR